LEFFKMALSAGFSDQSRFATCFREFVGASPQQFRRMQQ
jgi:AraC-like DNA-binding protein